MVEQLDERVFGKCGVNRSSGEGDRQLIKHVKPLISNIKYVGKLD